MKEWDDFWLDVMDRGYQMFWVAPGKAISLNLGNEQLTKH